MGSRGPLCPRPGQGEAHPGPMRQEHGGCHAWGRFCSCPSRRLVGRVPPGTQSAGPAAPGRPCWRPHREVLVPTAGTRRGKRRGQDCDLSSSFWIAPLLHLGIWENTFPGNFRTDTVVQKLTAPRVPRPETETALRPASWMSSVDKPNSKAA